jgi:hypothetical protein
VRTHGRFGLVYTAGLSRRGLPWRRTLDGRRVIESQQQSVDVV